jgi:hypothetical protein
VTAETLPVVHAAALEDLDEERRWLLDGLWATGVGIIGGAPKCCKSWLGLEIAVAVASATACLGRFPARAPGAALLYLAEDSAPVVKARLTSLCRHRGLALADLPIHVITAPSLRLDLPADQHRLRATVADQQPTVLLLDPFVRLTRIDENSSAEVSAVLAYLRALERESAASVVLVHHARKVGAQSAQAGQGLRGSGDFYAWGDSLLYLQRARDRLTLTVEHRAAPAPPPLGLRLVGRDGDAHLEITEAAVDGDDHLDERVVAALDKLGDMTRRRLRDHLHLRNQSIGDALRRLDAAGRIHQRGDHWSLAPDSLP